MPTRAPSFCDLRLLRYAFLHDDGHWDVHEGEIAVAQLRPDNQGLPSLLGWDVLRHFRITAEWTSRRISLERV